VVVGGEFQEAGMKMNGIAAAFQDHTAKIVGLQAPRRSTPVVKSMDVAEEKILQALVEEEFQPQGTTVGEGEDETGQTPAGAAHLDFAEVRPVGLRFFRGTCADAEKLPGVGAQVGDNTAELADTARVAPGHDHLKETGWRAGEDIAARSGAGSRGKDRSAERAGGAGCGSGRSPAPGAR